MATHKQETGHSSTSDLGRFRVQLHEQFSREYLSALKAMLMAIPGVTDCFTRAVAQAMMTTVWVKTVRGETEYFTCDLERSDYERLLNKFENNHQCVLDHYTEQTVAFVKSKIDQLNAPTGKN